jgi:hypothetical protein
MITIFSSSKNLCSVFAIYLSKHIVLHSLYATLILYASKKYGNSFFLFILFIFILVIFFDLFKAYVYCKNYIHEILLYENSIKLNFKKLLCKDDSGYKIIEIAKDKISVQVSESLLSINTIGITVHKIEFNKGKELVFTQYPVGDWNYSEMKRIKLEFARIEKERIQGNSL